MYFAEFAAQHGNGGLQQNENAFLLLWLSRQLSDIGPALDDAFIAEVHRHEHHGALRIAYVASHRHRQHAGARRKQPAGAAAPAFDEILERMAARHHETQVLGEYHGIQRIALEAAAQEECPALAQETPDHGHVEIRARGDVRDRESLAVDDVRQQQVIHVAAMAGHINDLGSVGDVAQVFDMLELDAVVQRIPQAAQCHGHEGDEGLRIIGGDFARILARQQQCLASLYLAHLHFFAHRLADGLGLQDLQHHGAPMRKIRADARGALRTQHHTQRTQHPAYAALLSQSLVQTIAKAYRRAEVHQGIAAIEYDAQKFLDTPDQDPIFRERQ